MTEFDGRLVHVYWREDSGDWPYFYLLAMGNGLVRLRGADYPDGSIRHDGGVVWVRVSDIEEIEEIHGERNG